MTENEPNKSGSDGGKDNEAGDYVNAIMGSKPIAPVVSPASPPRKKTPK